MQNLFNLDYAEDGHLLLEVLLHMGTLVSIFIVYRSEIRAMISDGLDFLRKRSETDSGEPAVLTPPARTAVFVIIGTAPMLIAVFFVGSINRLFYLPGFVGFALLITGGLIFVSDRYINRGNKTEKTMTLADALIIGVCQAVALIPGLSRSGTTISVGLARGLSGSFAVRFSLLLSIPAVIGATILTLYMAIRDGVDFSLFFVYLAGAIVAAVVGFFSIQLIRRLVVKGRFGNFAYYCWGLGALTMILSLVVGE